MLPVGPFLLGVGHGCSRWTRGRSEKDALVEFFAAGLVGHGVVPRTACRPAALDRTWRTDCGSARLRRVRRPDESVGERRQLDVVGDRPARVGFGQSRRQPESHDDDVLGRRSLGRRPCGTHRRATSVSGGQHTGVPGGGHPRGSDLRHRRRIGDMDSRHPGAGRNKPGHDVLHSSLAGHRLRRSRRFSRVADGDSAAVEKDTEGAVRTGCLCFSLLLRWYPDFACRRQRRGARLGRRAGSLGSSSPGRWPCIRPLVHGNRAVVRNRISCSIAPGWSGWVRRY